MALKIQQLTLLAVAVTKKLSAGKTPAEAVTGTVDFNNNNH